MSEAIITPLRPKAKDSTGAQRQARFRSKKKRMVTVVASAPPTPITGPPPPPLAGRDITKPVPERNGGAGIDVAAYTAAIALAGAAAYFSIRGMTVLFPGAPLAIIGMAVSMEVAKLVTAGWLARRWRTTAWVCRSILVALVAGLALISAAGVYAQLVAAHVGERGAAASSIEAQDVALAASIELASHAVADLDRHLGQIDVVIEEAAKRGKTNAALSAMDSQRKMRAGLVGEREKAAGVLASLKTERAQVAASCRAYSSRRMTCRAIRRAISGIRVIAPPTWACSTRAPAS
jgi:hypothetical protein